MHFKNCRIRNESKMTGKKMFTFYLFSKMAFTKQGSRREQDRKKSLGVVKFMHRRQRDKEMHKTKIVFKV